MEANEVLPFERTYPLNQKYLLGSSVDSELCTMKGGLGGGRLEISYVEREAQSRKQYIFSSRERV